MGDIRFRGAQKGGIRFERFNHIPGVRQKGGVVTAAEGRIRGIHRRVFACHPYQGGTGEAEDDDCQRRAHARRNVAGKLCERQAAFARGDTIADFCRESENGEYEERDESRAQRAFKHHFGCKSQRQRRGKGQPRKRKGRLRLFPARQRIDEIDERRDEEREAYAYVNKGHRRHHPKLHGDRGRQLHRFLSRHKFEDVIIFYLVRDDIHDAHEVGYGRASAFYYFVE